MSHAVKNAPFLSEENRTDLQTTPLSIFENQCRRRLIDEQTNERVDILMSEIFQLPKLLHHFRPKRQWSDVQLLDFHQITLVECNRSFLTHPMASCAPYVITRRFSRLNVAAA